MSAAHNAETTISSPTPHTKLVTFFSVRFLGFWGLVWMKSELAQHFNFYFYFFFFFREACGVFLPAFPPSCLPTFLPSCLFPSLSLRKKCEEMFSKPCHKLNIILRKKCYWKFRSKRINMLSAVYYLHVYTKGCLAWWTETTWLRVKDIHRWCTCSSIFQ